MSPNMVVETGAARAVTSYREMSRQIDEGVRKLEIELPYTAVVFRAMFSPDKLREVHEKHLHIIQKSSALSPRLKSEDNAAGVALAVLLKLNDVRQHEEARKWVAGIEQVRFDKKDEAKLLWESIGSPPRIALVDANFSSLRPEALGYFNARMAYFRARFAIQEMDSYKQAREAPDLKLEVLQLQKEVANTGMVGKIIKGNTAIEEYLTRKLMIINQAAAIIGTQGYASVPEAGRAILASIQINGCFDREYLMELVMTDWERLQRQQLRDPSLKRDSSFQETLSETFRATRALGLQDEANEFSKNLRANPSVLSYS